MNTDDLELRAARLSRATESVAAPSDFADSVMARVAQGASQGSAPNLVASVSFLERFRRGAPLAVAVAAMAAAAASFVAVDVELNEDAYSAFDDGEGAEVALLEEFE